MEETNHAPLGVGSQRDLGFSGPRRTRARGGPRCRRGSKTEAGRGGLKAELLPDRGHTLCEVVLERGSVAVLGAEADVVEEEVLVVDGSANRAFFGDLAKDGDVLDDSREGAEANGEVREPEREHGVEETRKGVNGRTALLKSLTSITVEAFAEPLREPLRERGMRDPAAVGRGTPTQCFTRKFAEAGRGREAPNINDVVVRWRETSEDCMKVEAVPVPRVVGGIAVGMASTWPYSSSEVAEIEWWRRSRGERLRRAAMTSTSNEGNCTRISEF